MIIKKDHSVTKREDVDIIPFLDYYYHPKKEDIYFSGIIEEKEKRPDYFIETTNTLIEVKEIHDRESNRKHAQWGKIINKLQKAVDTNKLLSKVSGTFLINTPGTFKTPTEQQAFDNASTQVLQAVIENKESIKVFGVEFEIKKVSEQEKIVVFGSLNGGGFIDPSNTIYENIKDKISTANIQLGYSPGEIKPSSKILLLVNKYYIPVWNWDLFKAISRVYDELLSYKNIDEIWYQFETKSKGFVHYLLYKKSFFEQFEKSKFVDVNSKDLELFANWFSALSELGDEKKRKLLLGLRHFLDDKKPNEIFPNPQTREEMIRLGSWLAEKALFDDVIWLIEQFIYDTDPPNPEDYKKEDKFNYHLQVINNEDTNIITTVLGHLAWVIQKLAVRKDYIVNSLQFTNILLNHPNLYVKLQGLVPLVEISARRQLLREYDRENNTKHYDQFREIAFDMLKNYSKYQAIADSLAHVFYYFKDLRTEEALIVLEGLKKAHEVAALFVYFGIFRKRQFKDQAQFNPEPLRKLLESIILDQKENNSNLQGNIAWNFWRILEETPDEFDTLKPFLDLFFSLPYKKEYYSSLERIIKAGIERNQEVCIPWFAGMIDKLYKFAEANKMSVVNVWIEPEIPLEFVAKNKPSILSGLVEKLVELWKLGAFIGSPKMIFETYKLVEDLNLKAELIAKFRTWYDELKTINPKLEEVDWE